MQDQKSFCILVCVHQGKTTNLYMPTKGSVVQRSASRAVRNVDVAQQRDQSLSAADRLVAGCYMKRRLPVLVPSVYVGAVFQQHRHRILKIEGVTSQAGRHSNLVYAGVYKWLCHA